MYSWTAGQAERYRPQLRGIVTLWPGRWGLRQGRRKGWCVRCTFHGWIGWSVADASVVRGHAASRGRPRTLLGREYLSAKPRLPCYAEGPAV